MATLSERLLILKNSRSLLQRNIAQQSGISLRTYQRYEYGDREPTLSALIALANYFDVSIDYLVGRSDDPARH